MSSNLQWWRLDYGPHIIGTTGDGCTYHVTLLQQREQPAFNSGSKVQHCNLHKTLYIALDLNIIIQFADLAGK